jgi:hypothetical protein
MEIKKVVKEVYETSDGKVFDNIKDAEKHETQIKSLKYFLVVWGADLTEGRTWGNNRSYILVNTKHSHEEFAEILCFYQFGTKHQFCQGVFGSNAIMPYWSIKPVLELDSSIKVEFAVEERFAEQKIYGEGCWDLRDKTKIKKIKNR